MFYLYESQPGLKRVFGWNCQSFASSFPLIMDRVRDVRSNRPKGTRYAVIERDPIMPASHWPFHFYIFIPEGGTVLHRGKVGTSIWDE